MAVEGRVRVMTRTSAVPHRRLDWLTDELAAWQRDGLVSAETAAQIRSRYCASRRLSFSRVVAGLGGAFVAVGVIWLVAANLDRIPPLVRLAAVVALWLGLVVAAEVLARRAEAESAADPLSRHGPSPLVGAARLLAAGAFGAAIFQSAQSLQVPAYSPSLVGWWAAGALAYAYAVTGLAPLALAAVTGTIWLVWASAQQAEGPSDFTAALLVGAVLATAIAVLHAAGGRIIPAWISPAWSTPLAAVWRVVAALLALTGLFAAALPVYTEDTFDPRTVLIVVAVISVLAALGGLLISTGVDRAELLVVLAVAMVAGLLVVWRPEGDIAEPTPALTARAVVSVLAYLGAAAWYALLGVRRDLPGLTWLATAALVVFTTVQSFAVFAPVVSGATLFLAVGVVLLVAGYLADRGRRHLLRLGRARSQPETPRPETPRPETPQPETPQLETGET